MKPLSVITDELSSADVRRATITNGGVVRLLGTPRTRRRARVVVNGANAPGNFLRRRGRAFDLRLRPFRFAQRATLSEGARPAVDEVRIAPFRGHHRPRAEGSGGARRIL